MTLGENLKNIMKEKGLTVRKLADQLHMSPSYLSDIRNDRQDPSLSKLKEIANALDVDVYDLLKTYRINEDEKNYISEDNYNNMYFTQDEMEFIKMYRELPENIKAEIRGEIKGIIRVCKNKNNIKRDA